MADTGATEAVIGYHFRDVSLLAQALTAAGAAVPSDATAASHSVVHGNKRLALLGDALIRLLSIDDWFPSRASPADAQKHFVEVGTNEILAFRGRQQGLERMISNHPSHGDDVPRTTLASTVEAIVGAVWLDSGNDLEQARAAMRALKLS